MSPSVLGRDPFVKPTADKQGRADKRGKAPRAKSAKSVKSSAAKAKAGAEAKRKRPAAKRAARPTPPPKAPGGQPAGGRHRPDGTDAAKTGRGEPSAETGQRLRQEQARRARDVAAEIDRQALLDTADEQRSRLIQLYYAVTKYLRPSTYGAKLGQMGMHWQADEVGPFGFDPDFWRLVKPFFQFLYDKYWRVELSGVENIPKSGRALLVANHSGSLPWDGIMLRLALDNHLPAGRSARFLVEDFVFHFPFLGPFVNRVGGVRACQDNATRLLEAEHLVGVFPEGVKGIGKLYRDRYQLQRFGRGGFVRLAMRTDSPVVPVAVVGGEEIHPMLSQLSWLAKSLGLPYLPVTPTFPWLGPLGLVPLPSKWMIRIGQPLSFGPLEPQEADNPDPVMDKVEQVRGAIQQMIDALLKERKHPFVT